MNSLENIFIEWIESRYGKYIAGIRSDVAKWISIHDSYFVAAMREIILREHSSHYGKPPDEHDLETWKIEAYQRGHTLEAIAKARNGIPQIAAEVVENVTPEEAERKADEFRRKAGMLADSKIVNAPDKTNPSYDPGAMRAALTHANEDTPSTKVDAPTFAAVSGEGPPEDDTFPDAAPAEQGVGDDTF